MEINLLNPEIYSTKVPPSEVETFKWSTVNLERFNSIFNVGTSKFEDQFLISQKTLIPAIDSMRGKLIRGRI